MMQIEKSIAKVIAVPSVSSGGSFTSHISLPRAPWEPAPVAEVEVEDTGPRKPDDWRSAVLSVLNAEPANIFDIRDRMLARNWTAYTDQVRATLASLCAEGLAVADLRRAGHRRQYYWWLAQGEDAEPRKGDTNA